MLAMRRCLLRLLCACVALGVATTSLAQASLAAPDGARVEPLGGDLRLNGRPVAMTRVLAEAPVQEVLAHYRKQLGRRQVERDLAGAHTLSAKIDDRFLTVRVKSLPGGKVEAWLMETALHEPARPPSVADLGIHQGQAVSTLESVDGGRRARTIVTVNRQSIDANRDTVAAVLGERGYRLVGEARANGQPGRTLLFQRGADDVFVTIAEQGDVRTVVYNATTPAQ